MNSSSKKDINSLKTLFKDNENIKYLDEVAISLNSKSIFFEQFQEFKLSSYTFRNNGILKKIYEKVNAPILKPTQENLELIHKKLHKGCKILIVGSGTIGHGTLSFYRQHQEDIIGTDVYNSPTVDLIADAHFLPFKDEQFDLVIIQAVLEHVLYPQLVVAEIYRILKQKGIIYAETPFLQHVHERNYDFTRFTHSGHRLLLKDFIEIKSGPIGGITDAFLWQIEIFFTALFRFKMAGKLFRLLLSPLKFLELIMSDTYRFTSSSGYYFIGEKSTNPPIEDREIIKYYKGI